MSKQKVARNTIDTVWRSNQQCCPVPATVEKLGHLLDTCCGSEWRICDCTLVCPPRTWLELATLVLAQGAQKYSVCANSAPLPRPCPMFGFPCRRLLLPPSWQTSKRSPTQLRMFVSRLLSSGEVGFGRNEIRAYLLPVHFAFSCSPPAPYAEGRRERWERLCTFCWDSSQQQQQRSRTYQQ